MRIVPHISGKKDLEMGKVAFKYWIKAARPKTLPVSMAPVVMSVAMAGLYQSVNWPAAAICLAFAIMAQILSNLVNDYADGVKGIDRNRIGPQRMVASGLIPPKVMRFGMIMFGILTFMVGFALIYWGGWVLLPFGIVILLCALAYSAGPYPLSSHALGDVAVVLFYGIAPVALTFFIQVGYVNWQIIAAGLAIGIVADNLLIVNNYRDAEQDAAGGKKTTVIVFGKPFMRCVYYLNPIFAVLLMCLIFKSLNTLFCFIPFLAYSIHVNCRFAKAKGVEFNKLIGLSSLESILFALTITIEILCLKI